MRILCIIDCLGSGGAQRQMTYLACGLKQRGHDVELFLTHPGADYFRPEIEAAGIPIHGTDRRGHRGFSWHVLIAIRRLLKSGFDGLVSFQLSANGYAVLSGLLLAGERPVVLCGERVANSSLGLKGRVGTVITSWLADAIVANSQSNAREIRRMSSRSAKVSVVWNGYPNVTTSRAPKPLSVLERPQLVAIGRLCPQKNPLRLVKALKALRARHGVTVELQWAGRAENDAHTVALLREVSHELAGDPELATHCHWLGEVTDVLPLYRRNDALILPSLYEGLPNSVCEAMLAGCPVIASNVCDNPLLLGQEERGLLCDPLSVDSIVDAILRFTRMSSEDRNSMATRARTFAEQRLSLDTMVSAYEALLRGGRGQPDAAV